MHMDKVSFQVLLTDDSIKEVDKLLSTKEYYLSSDNKLVFTPDTTTLQNTVAALNLGAIYE